jgi:hypothetical protein
VPFLTARKMIIEEFSRMFVIMRWHTILLKVTHFLQKQNFWWMAWWCPAALIIGQHLYHVHQRKMFVLVFQKTENTRCRFVMAHYTQWCWLAVPLILRGFIRQRSAKRESFLRPHVQKLVLGTPVSKEHCFIDYLLDWRPVALLRPFELCEVFQLALVYNGKRCMIWTFSNGCNCCSQRLGRPSIVV